MDHNERFIRIEGLTKEFDVGRSFLEKGQKLRAVDNVSLDIKRGETLGLVGESGCGKSTFGRCVLRLIEPTEGKVLYENKDLLQFSKDEMRKMRRKLQMVFQDPYASLNPRMTVMEIIKAPLDVYKIGTKEERIEKVLEMAKIVGLNADAMNRYPHEFSGGQRQRIVIARALILNPEFIVCDEPVSALDVSIRSQVLNLIHDIQKKYRVAVMYLGSIVEIAEKNELFSNPLHPYTQALLSAIPIPDVDAERKQIYLEGEVPSPLNPPSGCRFHTRCQYASQKCRELRPELNDIGNGHCIACHCAGKEKER